LVIVAARYEDETGEELMAIRLYWYGGNRNEVNFGDALSPLIVKLISGKDVTYAHIHSCDLAAIGSLLDKILLRQWKRKLRLRFDKIRIWGTGSFGPAQLPGTGSRLVYTAVRGHLTRNTIGLDSSVALGDPGLLIDRLDVKAEKKYRWGIIPHVADVKVDAILDLQKNNGNACVIDLADPDILAVARKIRSCDFIISTSLHGLITADAFGIPNVWMRVSDNITGGDWKFLDYFTTVGRTETEPLLLNGTTPDLRSLEETAARVERSKIDGLQDGLVAAFAKTGL
jgi:hypothetical protein